MSSHREAPAISKDPVADNTDLYAFVDPADTSKVTLLANFIPLEEPAGGPNFFQFGDEVLYEILIDNDGDGEEDIVYQFRFKTVVQNPGTLLFDLGALRPFQNLHLIPTPAAPGVNGTKGFNVHTIAIQVPKTDLTKGGFNPTDPGDPRSVIGVWSAARRRKGLVREKHGRTVETGPWVQVSRLGEPLINEVVIERGEKDRWNSTPPEGDVRFRDDYAHPQLHALLSILYQAVFPTLAALSASAASSVDLIAILLTGI